MLTLNVKSGKSLLAITLLSYIQIGFADEKWRWDSNARSNDNSRSSDLRNPVVFKKQFDYIDNRPLPQYEVSESVEGIHGRPLQKPPDFRPPADYRPDYEDIEQQRPTNNYPNRYPAGNNLGGGFGLGQGVRPQYPPNHIGQGLPRPSFWGDEHPGAINDNHDPAVLTGPVPSWVREPAIKNYDRCKCSVKFNCNSPGISFGQCDVGKQYCCYNSKGNALDGVNIRPQNHSPENGILVGPGGPVDNQRPHNRPPPRPIIDNRPYEYGNGSPGILVGPDGPTGNYGRPQNNRYPTSGNSQSHSINNGVLIGPGGPFDVPQRPYENSQRPYYRP